MLGAIGCDKHSLRPACPRRSFAWLVAMALGSMCELGCSSKEGPDAVEAARPPFDNFRDDSHGVPSALENLRASDGGNPPDAGAGR